jgi:hypothetical protein
MIPGTGDVYYGRSPVLGDILAEVAIVLEADEEKVRFARLVTGGKRVNYLQVMPPWQTGDFLEEYWHAASYETPGRERVRKERTHGS